MELQNELEAALASDQPYARLREVVQLAIANGAARERVRDSLERLRDQLRVDARDSEEDVLVAVLDDLSGWTSPHLKI